MRMQSGPTMFRATLDDLEQVFDGASVYVAYRTSRGFYPIKGGGKMGSQGFTELGHKAMGCQSKGGTDGSAGSGTGSVGFVYSVFPEPEEASETAANLEPEQAPSLIPVLKPRLRRFLQFAIPLDSPRPSLTVELPNPLCAPIRSSRSMTSFVTWAWTPTKR